MVRVLATGGGHPPRAAGTTAIGSAAPGGRKAGIRPAHFSDGGLRPWRTYVQRGFRVG
jgi:hypothetical protein